jgi:hypothetical protein
LVNQPRIGQIMKHYIVYTVLGWCMFELAVGDIDRMSRAINSPNKSRVISYT